VVNAEGKLLDWNTYRQYQAIDLLSFQVLLQPTVFMRKSVFEKTGLLSTDYHMIFDHQLWTQIAARYPILYLDEFWSVERKHEGAKTIAQAETFVDEAFRFIKTIDGTATFEPFFADNRDAIYAGLHIFAGLRLIDAGEPGAASAHFRKAHRFSPTAVEKVWYKVVQAFGGAIGLSNVFLAYRHIRRKIQHKDKQLVVDHTGTHWK
jgi:hypothetical protein